MAQERDERSADASDETRARTEATLNALSPAGTESLEAQRSISYAMRSAISRQSPWHGRWFGRSHRHGS